MKRLPLGIKTLKEIITENYIYIDKTQEALDLINNYKYVFLSRPRRFGKSLFVDTLKEIFQGNKELFKGLYIYDKYDFEKFPVIHISFSGSSDKSELINEILSNLKENEKELSVQCESSHDYAICFSELIRKTYRKYNKRVVILIDEYDKPILDVLDKPEIAKENREI